MWGDFINKKFVIYKVTNKINGKIYIGKTYNFEKRRREHIYDIENELPFHRA
jgi:predicted GIY-YIG superfamily endonuclease